MWNLADAIRHHARRRPGHPAIVYRGRDITYAVFDALVDSAAATLAAHGIGAGDRVAIALADRPEHLAFLFGAARLGAVFVPLDCRWAASEKERVAAHFGVKLVLTEPGDAWTSSVPTLAIAVDWTPARANPQPSAEAGPDGERPLAVFLSSGTTGQPKGPLLTHGNLYGRFLIYHISLTINEHDRYACVTPLYFGASRGMAMCVLHAGATLVLLPPPMPVRELMDSINRTGCTSASLVPTLIRRMLEEHRSDGYCLPGLKTVISTGAALHPHERSEALQRLSPNLMSFYGSSEGGGAAVLMPHHPPEKAGSAGAIVFGAEVRVVNDRFEEVPPGEIGRICYRSAGSARAFLNEPERSSESFHEGWFLPGDLGRVDADGFLYITGREKDMIIRGGANVYPSEIENVLLRHAAVAEAAVVGRFSKEYGEEVVAYVVLAGEVSTDELTAFCRNALAPYKVPREFRVIDEMPKTAFGKVDKLALRHRVSAGQPRPEH